MIAINIHAGMQSKVMHDLSLVMMNNYSKIMLFRVIINHIQQNLISLIEFILCLEYRALIVTGACGKALLSVIRIREEIGINLLIIPSLCITSSGITI